MKRTYRALGLIGAALAVALGAAACGSSGSSGTASAPASPVAAAASPSASTVASTTTVAMAKLPEVVHARVGDTIKVTLRGNTASTGYQWATQDLSDVAVLKQVGEGVVIPSKSTLAGGPDRTRFTFKVVKTGMDAVGFWYQPPGGGSPGATAALVVSAKKGHVPVNVDAGEDFTAETAQMRVGDALVVTIGNASDSGRHSWKMIGGSDRLRMVNQKFAKGNQIVTFAGVSGGSTTLVMVNRPSGDPPLQTYALPVVLKVPKAPITVQMNTKSNGKSFVLKAGDTIQVALPEKEGSPYQWKFQKPKKSVLKQVGKPKFFANSGLLGAGGKTVWTFAVAGPGKAALIAGYQSVATGDIGKTWQVGVAAKPGFTPKTVSASTNNPAATVHVLPGDTIKLKLSSSAGVWSKPKGTKQFKVKKPVKQGKQTVIACTAKRRGVSTLTTVANAASGYPSQAYAFSATVGKGKAPVQVSVAAGRGVKPIKVSAGQAFDIALESNTASTDYNWQVASLVPDGVIQLQGDPEIKEPDSALPGASGETVFHFKALAAGSAQLVLGYMPPGDGGVPDAVYMTIVDVQ